MNKVYFSFNWVSPLVNIETKGNIIAIYAEYNTVDQANKLMTVLENLGSKKLDEYIYSMPRTLRSPEDKISFIRKIENECGCAEYSYDLETYLRSCFDDAENEVFRKIYKAYK